MEEEGEGMGGVDEGRERGNKGDGRRGRGRGR